MVTISIGTLVGMTTTIICSVISGIVLFSFTGHKKQEEEARKRRVETDVAERELLLSLAGATEVLLKKVNNEKLNGEVKSAEAELKKKKDTLQKLTRVDFFEEREGII